MSAIPVLVPRGVGAGARWRGQDSAKWQYSLLAAVPCAQGRCVPSCRVRFTKAVCRGVASASASFRGACCGSPARWPAAVAPFYVPAVASSFGLTRGVRRASLLPSASVTSAVVPRRSASTDSFSLDELFKELGVSNAAPIAAVATAVGNEEERSGDTSYQRRAAPQEVSMHCNSSTAGDCEAVPPSKEESECHFRINRLQRQLEEVSREASAASRAEQDELRRERRKNITVSAPAQLAFSSAELIQEKAPQHFTPNPPLSPSCAAAEHAAPPLMPAAKTGHVAMVTLVASVVENRGLFSDEENGEYGALLVRYTVPLAGETSCVHAEVRCYGATLSSFCTAYVACGDVVHVLGHLLPLRYLTDSEAPAFAICALPVGGNISVLVPAALTSDAGNPLGGTDSQ